MAHRVSAAALHAARVLLRSYKFSVKPKRLEEDPKLQADERCIAIIIDCVTNVYMVSELRPVLRYWQDHMYVGTATADQIGSFFERIVEAFSAIPSDLDQQPIMRLPLPPLIPQKFEQGRPYEQTISQASMKAVHALLDYYDVELKKPRPPTVPQDPEGDRIRIGALLEVSLALGKARKALEWVCFWRERLKQGQATEDEIRKCLRETGVFLAYLPGYEDVREETKLL